MNSTHFNAPIIFVVLVVYPLKRIIGTKIMGAISMATFASPTMVPMNIPKRVASQLSIMVPSINKKKF